MQSVSLGRRARLFDMNDQENLNLYEEFIYFSDFVAASYGWPFYINKSKLSIFKLIPTCVSGLLNRLRLLFSKNKSKPSTGKDTIDKNDAFDDFEQIENDNCCWCYYKAAVKQLPNINQTENTDIKIMYANFVIEVC